MKKILYAFRFLTILPIPWKQNEDLKVVGRSIIFFPLVGLVLGLFFVIFVNFLHESLLPLTLSVIVVVLWIVLTGGLHLDGLSDLFDGMGGRSIEDRLRIMKDSNIGAFGAIALISIIIFKISLVNEILSNFNEKSVYILVLAPAWGRLMELLAIRFYKSARPGGMGDFFKKEIREVDWILPLLFMFSITYYLLHLFFLIKIAILICIMWFFSNSVSRKLGGLTGDCYGAICEITETLFLLLAVII